jgi:putative hydrolase of the HAD superfamily
MIKAVFFDFGGVLAEEGFRQGIKAIAEKSGLDPEAFFLVAEELMYQTGYVVGAGSEAAYWDALRKRTGITAADGELRGEVLKRFVLRQEMLDYADRLKSSGIVTSILSDQTNWLDEINAKTSFYQHFDHVFNSFTMNKSKKDQSIFRDVYLSLGFKPEEVIFVDDNINNIKRASAEGLNVIHFTGIGTFKKDIEKHIGDLLPDR